MSVWTLSQIDQVRGVRATVVLDPLVLAQTDGEVEAVARDKLATRFVGMCHPFAVEVNAADLEWRTEADDFGVHVTGRWRPSTVTVQLVGGPSDGQILDVRGAPAQPVEIAVRSEPNWVSSSMWPSLSEVWSDRVTYRLSGWHETGRHWLYSPS